MTTETNFTHINEQGKANMVDVTEKNVTQRQAIAEGYIRMSELAFSKLKVNQHAKGDVLSIARIAGIQGAKRCSDLIPLCHPLMLSKVQIDFETLDTSRQVRIIALCKLAGQTGVEMEALTAVSVAALTLFDMCKAVDPLMEIDGIRVLKKQGGKSGDWQVADKKVGDNKVEQLC
ncbi:cyclic pyranopterin monophosphate synthase MoaC [Paraglaciecola aquimarina]|uniref:Cyclic pyranopterin monophosphate synthase n=1 Tax=Paraglaciecola algarum TaxID=3050085 RepID=A0ABS9DB18_9ALTE|nr:cyclic pyranopterin monophosphate synthase MoaC [Paraglaciecola sp. G1-23]MCF2948999.1 cyclic pyranopterin monophosphate synthase MoaC [Paraglaciecola sp. G1-23]